MLVDLNTLRTELQTDPDALGYAAFINNGNRDGLLALLNTVNSNITVKDLSVPRDIFLLKVVAPFCLVLATKPPDVQAKWDRILALVHASASINIADPVVGGLFAQAMSDGLLTQQTIDGVGARPGSRAEFLFGPGVSVTSEDLAKILNP